MNLFVTFLSFISYPSHISSGRCCNWQMLDFSWWYIAQETRDLEGKERFLVFDVGLNIVGNYPEWYIIWHEKGGALKVWFAKLI